MYKQKTTWGYIHYKDFYKASEFSPGTKHISTLILFFVFRPVRKLIAIFQATHPTKSCHDVPRKLEQSTSFIHLLLFFPEYHAFLHIQSIFDFISQGYVEGKKTYATALSSCI